MASRTLDPKTQRRLIKNARAAGVTPARYVDELEATANGVRQEISPTQVAAQSPSESAAEAFEVDTGADLTARIRTLRLSGAYGDPNLDSPELARQLREQAQTRRRT